MNDLKSPNTNRELNSPKSNKVMKIALIGGGILAIAFASYFYFAGGTYMHGSGHRIGHHGADGKGHDEVNMPGLRGEDASELESAELADMFRGFEKITRTVTNLSNGIKTTTFSKDEKLMATVVSHVVGMIGRVEEGRDPKIIIQSPTLDILFEKRAEITTEVETTELGIVVTQTSDNPNVVTALQTHAAEVSDMVERGMQAVHEKMMKH